MKCGRIKCKICNLGYDELVYQLRNQGLGYKAISKRLNYRVSHMGVKRHLKALNSEKS